MNTTRTLFALGLALAITTLGLAQDKPKRLLFVTHSGGFIHPSVGHAEDVMKELAPKHGYEVTCWRYTNDLDGLEAYSKKYRERSGKLVEPKNCGRINAETLKNYDAVLFFTTGNPVNRDELKELLAWVKAGGAFAGTHCATDTLYNTPYGDLIGGYFDGHPWNQDITLKVEKPKHPAMKGFENGDGIRDEIYQFKNFDRDKLTVLMTVNNDSIDVSKGKRDDNDYAVSWVKDYGQGKVFYTSLGHFDKVWDDKRFQKHLFAGLDWATKK